MDPLIASLRRIRRRLLAVRAAEAGLAGAVVAAVPALVVTGLRIALPRLLPTVLAHPAAAPALLTVGFFLAFVVRLVVGVSLHEAARAADRAARLDDRLATALEVMEGQPGRAPSRRGEACLASLLLADARRAAGRLDPRALPLARTLGRRGRLALAAAVVLATLSLVPSLAGPPVDRPAAHRAARSLASLAEEESLAPAVRRAVRQAVADLRRAGAHRQDAERRTAAVRRAAEATRQARRNIRDVLASAPAEEVQRMIRAARTGDAAGAKDAAGDLADRLAGAAGAAGGASMGPAARDRLGDSLDDAVPHAREGGLADLERALADVARAVRSADAEGAGEPLRRLAGTMVRALGPEGEKAVADAVETVDRARRAMGLSAMPEAAVAAGPDAGGEAVAEGERETPTDSAEQGKAIGKGASAVTVPDEVRPEDREVVRRYFGG